MFYTKKSIRIPATNITQTVMSRQTSGRTSIDSGTCVSESIDSIIDRCISERDRNDENQSSVETLLDGVNRVTITPVDEKGFECQVQKSIQFDYRMGKIEYDIPILLPEMKVHRVPCRAEWVDMKVFR